MFNICTWYMTQEVVRIDIQRFMRGYEQIFDKAVLDTHFSVRKAGSSSCT